MTKSREIIYNDNWGKRGRRYDLLQRVLKHVRFDIQYHAEMVVFGTDAMPGSTPKRATACFIRAMPGNHMRSHIRLCIVHKSEPVYMVDVKTWRKLRWADIALDVFHTACLGYNEELFYAFSKVVVQEPSLANLSKAEACEFFATTPRYQHYSVIWRNGLEVNYVGTPGGCEIEYLFTLPDDYLNEKYLLEWY